MNGRAPGFASATVYVPGEKLLVVALSNIYASVPAEMASEIAATAMGKPYERLTLKSEIDQASLAGLPAAFQFSKDFYQPNALVHISEASGSVKLAWPNGDTSVLIPTAKDHYIDRAYRVPVELVRNVQGDPVQLKYDCFTGDRRKS